MHLAGGFIPWRAKLHGCARVANENHRMDHPIRPPLLQPGHRLDLRPGRRIPVLLQVQSHARLRNALTSSRVHQVPHGYYRNPNEIRSTIHPMKQKKHTMKQKKHTHCRVEVRWFLHRSPIMFIVFYFKRSPQLSRPLDIFLQDKQWNGLR